MTSTLRIILLVVSILVAYWILMRIRKAKVRMEDAIFWVVFALILSMLGLFPQISYWLAGKLGVQSPANIVFLVIIALLIEKIFTLSIILSQLEDKVSVLSAEVAIREHGMNQKEELEAEELEAQISDVASKEEAEDEV